MSFRVFVMPEDPTHNGYILKPLAEKILSAVGKRNAVVTVIASPRPSGYEDAKRILKEHIRTKTYPSPSLILFLPDSDGNDRLAEFRALKNFSQQHGANLICCAAVPEVEAWLLAGHIGRNWNQVQNSPTLKETHFEPFLKQHGRKSAGGGRKELMGETLKNYRGLKSRCPEIQKLEDDIRDFLKQNP